MPDSKKLDELCLTTIRMLAVDMVEKANSGHPGLPLGAAPMAYVLYKRIMRYNPKNPAWPGRDRFVLSPGHGSALLYAVLHMFGFDLSLEDLKNFRQWGSPTAGHPEYGHCPGVETTTGPLGHGLAMGVGFALAERYLGAQFNRPGHDIVDHYTYGIVSDGDMMEGVASEAASLAGTLKLGKLIYLYDDNKITIEGGTDLAFGEDVGKRFEAYGWQVLRAQSSSDLDELEAQVLKAQTETQKPSLIICPTKIGFGSPKENSPSAHGEPLGAEAMAATREHYGWPSESFHVPAEAAAELGKAAETGAGLEKAWQDRMEAYAREYPELAATLKTQLAGKLPAGWEDSLPVFDPADGKMATRGASGVVINAIAPRPARPGGRIGGPGPLHQDPDQRHGRHAPRGRSGPQHPFRSSRARHGGHRKRHGPARRGDSLRGHLLCVQRFLPSGPASGRPDGSAQHLGVHP